MSEITALQLVAEVMSAADAFLRESHRLFRPLGLTAAQYNVLNVLSGHPSGMSQRELSDVLVVDRSNVTGLLDRMEKAGWVQRGDDPSDRRVYRVTLTPAGRKLWQKAQPRYAAVVEQVSSGLSARQIREAHVALQRLRAAASTWALPDGPEGSP